MMAEAYQKRFGEKHICLTDNIALPTNEIMELLRSNLDNSLSAIASNEIRNPEFWNSVATFLVRFSPDDTDPASVIGNFSLYNQALYLATLENTSANKFFYNLVYAYGKYCDLWKRKPAVESLEYLFNHVFSHEGQRFHWFKDRLAPLFKVLGENWSEISKWKVVVQKMESDIENLLCDRGWLGASKEAYKWMDKMLDDHGIRRPIMDLNDLAKHLNRK